MVESESFEVSVSSFDTTLAGMVQLAWTAEELMLDSWRGQRDFSLLHSLQTRYGAHPASYPMGIGGSFPSPKIKRPGHEADHSPVCVLARSRIRGSIRPLLHIRVHGAVFN
jgi:hypothetical protein